MSNLLTNRRIIFRPSFVPSNIANLALWLDASDATTITLDGSSNVEEWRDKSGNLRHAGQASTTKRPSMSGSINGINCPTFDGTDDALETATIAINQPDTVCLVLRPTSLSSFRVIFDTPSATRQGVFFQGGTPFYTAGIDAGASSAISINTNNQLIAVFNGGSSLMRVNQAATTAGNPGTGNFNGALQISGRGTSFYYEGQVAEIIWYSKALDATERGQIETYFKSKWATV
jgi:hypothetical protein